MNLQILLQDHRLYHSELQQDYFITTRSGGTVYGKYKQALRELYKRFRGLKGLYYERDIAKIDLEELVDKEAITKYDERRRQVKIRKAKYDLIEMNKNIEDTEREFKRFYQQSAGLKQLLGELTEDKVKELDREMWHYKLKEMAFIDYATAGGLRNNTIELLGCLPLEDRLELLPVVKDIKALDDWYWGDRHAHEDLKEISDTSTIDVSKLLNS